MASNQAWGQISVAAEKVEQNLQADSKFRTLYELLRSTDQQPSLSGLQDIDYPNMRYRIPTISSITKVPLPTEVIEQYINTRQNCALGIFPEISRAWLSVDSCIFFWTYDNAGDVAYYDGLDQTILAVHLLKPKPNVFKSHIQYILCLITASEITLLGVTCPQDESSTGSLSTFLLIPDPLFKISTENVILSVVAGTEDGRIFMAGNDGCLYEIVYQAEDGWFSRKCRKINHSHSILSYVTPAFLNFSENEPIVQIEIDSGRNLLFARTEKSTLQLYDLGQDGTSMRHVNSKTLSAVVNQASCIARTIDTSNFKPIVGIKALAKNESENINMVAVTQAGVRLYFSASGSGRPSSLDLVHVRLPPGFTPSSAVQRPNSVSNIYLKDNTYIMTSPQTDNKDFLWILTNDYYVYEDQLMESFGVSSLEGRVWCIAEDIRTPMVKSSYEPRTPPLIVKQHFEERRKFVLLTSEGVYIFHKHRPVDQLSLLLTENQNPEAPAVRSFFQETKLTEACLTSLILASSSHLPQEVSLVGWSTLAFFRYGSAQVDSNFTARHDAIYLYLARILRPLWLLKVAEEIDVCPFLTRLIELKGFIDSNSHIVGDQSKQPNKISLRSPPGPKSKWSLPSHLDNRNTADHSTESESLSSLICLLTRCIEVLNLYKLLYDHRFSISLPQEPQHRLSVMTFKDLIVVGGDMTTSVASALVRRYLDDNITTDAICRRLHELCPSIFRQENALQAKAHEMILQSRTIKAGVDYERMMNEAVSLLKKIGTRLDLQAVCDLLHSARAYRYIVDICLFVAEKRDPLNLANFQQPSRLMNGTLDETEERNRTNAVNFRMDCYMKIIDTLDRLLNKDDFNEVFQACVKSSDELFHTKLYEWLCEKNLSSKLLEVQSPFVETFLKRKAESDSLATSHLDLLWRFYERRNNFFGAALVLDKLASKVCADYDLEERLAYLSRAKACVEAMATPGEHLHELEEKMDVVRIQIQVFKRLRELHETNSPTMQDALTQLNYSLLNLTQLYQDYAEKFNLYDCQLAILKCGNHYDPALIEKLWKKVIDEIWQRNQNESPDTQLHILGNRIEDLGKSLMPSERFFPAYYIISYLEFKTHEYNNLRWIPHCLMKIGFKPINLLDPYHRFYKSREHSIYWQGKSTYALRVIGSLIEDTLNDSDRQFATACLDVICDYLIDLQTMAADNTVRRLQETFTVLQSRINRMLK